MSLFDNLFFGDRRKAKVVLTQHLEEEWRVLLDVFQHFVVFLFKFPLVCTEKEGRHFMQLAQLAFGVSFELDAVKRASQEEVRAALENGTVYLLYGGDVGHGVNEVCGHAEHIYVFFLLGRGGKAEKDGCHRNQQSGEGKSFHNDAKIRKFRG